MISFVCCSINPSDAIRLEDNIRHTIGDMPFEFIAYDNREHNHGMCKVYNLCAERAQYDYLCFLHEDVAFVGDDWGNEMIRKLSEDDCGVVGFAGSRVKADIVGGWLVSEENARTNYLQHFKQRSRGVRKKLASFQGDYAEVITLDGMALFVRKKVWSEVRFDEDTFDNFHFYDLDFSLAVSLKYKNYVTSLLLIEHFSEGKYDRVWLDEAEKMRTKWSSSVPQRVCCGAKYKISEARYIQMKIYLRMGLFEDSYKKIFQLIAQQPFYLPTWLLLFKNIKYRRNTR